MAKQNKNSSFGKTGTSAYESMQGLVYARVSSKRQEIEGSGLQSQENRCIKDLATVGVPYVKTFRDSYTGGGDFMKRPAMREMLTYIDANPHKRYVVDFDDLKRFARDVEFHIKLRAAFKARDVVLRCLNYNFDDSPEGRFSETIMAAQAELERHQNRRQVIQKQKARLEAGYWTFGSKKGYVMTRDPMHGKLAVPHTTEAPALKKALEGFSTGEFVRRIDACKFLFGKKFFKVPPEKYIHRFTLLVKDPFYAGFIEYPSWEVSRRPGHHKAIISLETFQMNQKRLGKEAFNKRIRMDITPDFPLRGLLICAGCNEHLTSGWSTGRPKAYAYYVCHNKLCPFYGKSLRKKDVEGQFETLLKRQGLRPEIEKMIRVVFDRVWNKVLSSLHENSALLLQERKALEKKAKQLTEMIIGAKSESLKRVYEAQLEETAKKIEEWEEQSIEGVDLTIPYRTALAKAVGLLRNPYSIWENLEVSEKQKLFYFIFEQKLPYAIKEGYRTTEIACATRLFEDFATQNPRDVEMIGVEPMSKMNPPDRLQA